MSAFWSLIKNKKSTLATSYRGYSYNHPQRLSQLGLSGTLSYTRDERDFTGILGVATRYVFDLDYSLATPWNRVLVEKQPWGALPVTLADGEFTMGHKPLYMWEVNAAYGGDPAEVVIGTCTATPYSRATISDPWTAGTDVVTDVNYKIIFLMYDGGLPPSMGRGTDTTLEKVTIEMFEGTSGTATDLLPSFYAKVLRLPWTATWASETAIFSGIFSAFITASNTADGGGHSGSCSLSVDFTY
jgi:hypothetical protein